MKDEREIIVLVSEKIYEPQAVLLCKLNVYKILVNTTFKNHLIMNWNMLGDKIVGNEDYKCMEGTHD